MSRTVRVRRLARRLRSRGRFYVAVTFTVFVAAYVLVPWIVAVLGTMGGHDPAYYEPRDLQRQDWLKSLPVIFQTFLGWETAFKLLLIVLVGLFWVIAAPFRR